MHQLILLYLEVFYLPIGHFQHGVESFSPSAYTALFYLLSVIDTTSFKIVGDFVSVPESPMCNSNRFISCSFLEIKKTENIIMKGTYLAVKLYEIFFLHLDIVQVRNVIGYIIDKQA